MKSCRSNQQPSKVLAVVSWQWAIVQSQLVVFLTELKRNGPPVRRKEEETLFLTSSLLNHDDFRAFCRGLKAMESGPHWSESQKVENLDSLHNPTSTTKTKTTSKMTEAACPLLFYISQGTWHTLKHLTFFLLHPPPSHYGQFLASYRQEELDWRRFGSLNTLAALNHPSFISLSFGLHLMGWPIGTWWGETTQLHHIRRPYSGTGRRVLLTGALVR